MEFTEQISRLVPRSPEDHIDWEQIGSLFSGTPFPEMKNTPQNPVYHGEGDVYARFAAETEMLKAKPLNFQTAKDDILARLKYARRKERQSELARLADEIARADEETAAALWKRYLEMKKDEDLE